MSEPKRHYLNDPMDRLVAIRMESPRIEENPKYEAEFGGGRLVDRYDFNFLCHYVEKAIEAGIKL